jgi:hypothetical protein
VGPFRLDRTVSLGHVLQVVVLLLGLWAATVRLESRITALETKIDPVWQWFTSGRAAAGVER